MTIDRLAEYCSLTGPANQSPSDGRWTRGKWACRHRLVRRIAPERQKARPKNKHGCRVSQLTRRADDTAWWCFIAEADRTAAITGWIPVPFEKHNGTNGEKNLGVGVGSSLYWDCFVKNQPLIVMRFYDSNSLKDTLLPPAMLDWSSISPMVRGNILIFVSFSTENYNLNVFRRIIQP